MNLLILYLSDLIFLVSCIAMEDSTLDPFISTTTISN